MLFWLKHVSSSSFMKYTFTCSDIHTIQTTENENCCESIHVGINTNNLFDKFEMNKDWKY